MKSKGKGQFRSVSVHSTAKISKHLMRISFTGEDLNDFPIDSDGGYVKVILESDKSQLSSDHRPKMRSYTVADFDKDKKILTIDFMVGRHSGHTSSWAKSAVIEDEIVIGGPGPRKLNEFKSDKYIFFGDLTSINAVRAGVKRLPAHAQSETYLFIPGIEDKFDIDIEEKTNVNWIVSDQSDYLTLAAKQSNILSSDTIIFAAGEAQRIKSLRTYLIEDIGLKPELLFMSGYWREGLTDEQYREEKMKNR